jgi:hypothetical protein
LVAAGDRRCERPLEAVRVSRIDATTGSAWRSS